MGFVKWHKGMLNKYKAVFNLDDYQVMWIAWFKGIIMGLLIAYFLI